MNKFESERRFAERMKRCYPPGTRLLLLSMDDPYAPIECGMKGTVVHVDDAAQIHMRWDNGRTLAIVPGEDSFRMKIWTRITFPSSECEVQKTKYWLDAYVHSSIGYVLWNECVSQCGRKNRRL